MEICEEGLTDTKVAGDFVPQGQALRNSIVSFSLAVGLLGRHPRQHRGRNESALNGYRIGCERESGARKTGHDSGACGQKNIEANNVRRENWFDRDTRHACPCCPYTRMILCEFGGAPPPIIRDRIIEESGGAIAGLS